MMRRMVVTLRIYPMNVELRTANMHSNLNIYACINVYIDIYLYI